MTQKKNDETQVDASATVVEETQSATVPSTEIALPEPTDQAGNVDVFPPADLVEELEVGFNPNEIKFLVYGESGVGKTVFAATWPKVIFVDIDRGLASVRHKISRIVCQDWVKLQMAYTYLASGNHGFQTVVIDSLNELQKVAMAHVVGAYSGIRRSYDSLPSQSDYGKMLDDFDKLVRAFRSLPMHVVFISNVAGKEFETDIIQPQLTGKSAARNVCRLMDIVGYLYKAESSEAQKPRVMVFDDTNFVTKDRSGVLPTTVNDPSYTRLYEIWLKSLK